MRLGRGIQIFILCGIVIASAIIAAPRHVLAVQCGSLDEAGNSRFGTCPAGQKCVPDGNGSDVCVPNTQTQPPTPAPSGNGLPTAPPAGGNQSGGNTGATSTGTQAGGNTGNNQTGGNSGGTPAVGHDITIPNPLSCGDLGCILGGLISKLNILAIPVVVIIILVGAYMLLFSGGNEDMIKKGRKTIMYAVIGYAIIFISGALVTLVQDIFSK